MSTCLACALADTIHAYADAVDESDFAALARIFATGSLALHEPGGKHEAHGPDAAVALLRGAGVPPGGPPQTRHLVTNLRVAREADAATATASFVVFHTGSPRADQPATLGRYRWRFVRAGEEWTVARLDIHVEYRGG